MQLFIPIPGKIYKLCESTILPVKTYYTKNFIEVEGLLFQDQTHSDDPVWVYKAPRGSLLKFNFFDIKHPSYEKYESSYSLTFLNIPNELKNIISSYPKLNFKLKHRDHHYLDIELEE